MGYIYYVGCLNYFYSRYIRTQEAPRTANAFEKHSNYQVHQILFYSDIAHHGYSRMGHSVRAQLAMRLGRPSLTEGCQNENVIIRRRE